MVLKKLGDHFKYNMEIFLKDTKWLQDENLKTWKRIWKKLVSPKIFTYTPLPPLLLHWCIHFLNVRFKKWCRAGYESWRRTNIKFSWDINFPFKCIFCLGPNPRQICTHFVEDVFLLKLQNIRFRKYCWPILSIKQNS